MGGTWHVDVQMSSQKILESLWRALDGEVLQVLDPLSPGGPDGSSLEFSEYSLVVCMRLLNSHSSFCRQVCA